VPTIEFRCTEGHDFEKVLRMSEPRSGVVCACGQPATQVFLTAPPISILNCREFSGFDVGLGRAFSSREERRRFLKENGMHEWGPEQSEAYDRKFRDEQQKELDMKSSTYTDATIKPKAPEWFGNFKLGAIKPAAQNRDILPAEDAGKTIDLGKVEKKKQHHPALRPRVAKAIR